MESLKEIYDKKSPLFIVTISIFIIAIIAKGEPMTNGCHQIFWVSLFEGLVILVGGAEILVKTVLMEIFNKCCSTSIHKIHNIVVIVFMLANLALFVWSVLLYLALTKSSSCMSNQPHTYFVQVYAALYALINLVLLVALISFNF